MKKFLKWTLIVLVVLFVIGYLSSKNDHKSDSTTKVDKTDSSNSQTTEVESPKANWSYSEQTDEMNGDKMKFAIATSTNEVNFAPPYSGGSTFDFAIRKKDNKNAVYLSVSTGQFMGSMGDREVKLKFDNNPVMPISYTGTSDGRANLIFLGSVEKIISRTKRAKQLKVEAEFFQEGSKVIYFNVAGLNWK